MPWQWIGRERRRRMSAKRSEIRICHKFIEEISPPSLSPPPPPPRPTPKIHSSIDFFKWRKMKKKKSLELQVKTRLRAVVCLTVIWDVVGVGWGWGRVVNSAHGSSSDGSVIMNCPLTFALDDLQHAVSFVAVHMFIYVYFNVLFVV